MKIKALLNRQSTITYLILLAFGFFSGCEKEENNEYVSDLDGNRYTTIIIGDQEWFTENLVTTKLNDGTEIPLVTDNEEWGGLTSPAYCWYDNDSDIKNTYGNLYNWYAIETGKLCPEGWHVPSDEEWKVLEIHLGLSMADAEEFGYRGSNEASKLAGNYTLWQEGELRNNTEFEISGFYALPGGARIAEEEYFVNIGQDAFFWTSTETSPERALRRRINYSHANISRLAGDKYIGRSVRCIKDQ